MTKATVATLYKRWNALRATECTPAVARELGGLEEKITGTPAAVLADIEAKGRLAETLANDGCDGQVIALLKSVVRDAISLHGAAA